MGDAGRDDGRKDTGSQAHALSPVIIRAQAPHDGEEEGGRTRVLMYPGRDQSWSEERKRESTVMINAESEIWKGCTHSLIFSNESIALSCYTFHI
jgi:hypothetical protein